jgi:hypothetical protein
MLQGEQMSSSTLIQGIWLGCLIFQPLLVAVLLGKKAWRRLPVFTAYCICGCLETAVLYATRSHLVLYFWVYWFFEALGLLLGFAVVYEVFRTLFLQHAALRKLACTVFVWAIAAFTLLGWVVVYIHSSQRGGVLTGIFIVEEATRVVEVGLLLLLFVFSTVFGLHWRQWTFGMALGLGIFAAVELAALAMRVQFGIAATPTFTIVRGLASNASLLIWLGYLLVPERVASVAELPERAQLEQWNRAIMELINQ